MKGAVGNLSWKADNDLPNIVLMLADNNGFGDLGCYCSGGDLRGMPIPHLEELLTATVELTAQISQSRAFSLATWRMLLRAFACSSAGYQTPAGMVCSAAERPGHPRSISIANAAVA